MTINKTLSVKNINKSFGDNHVLKNISLDIKDGEFVTILGPSGCGKTTLLRVIAGLEKADGGVVCFGDRDITKESISKRGFGIVFQSYALFPNLNVFQNVAYGMKKASKEDKQKRVRKMLDLVGLNGIEKKMPAELSGGMQQRVALARALAVKPKLLLLDEPLSALDAKVRIKLREEICRIQKELGLTTIMVTHDQEEALTMADRIVVINKGEIMQYDTPQNLYNSPRNLFVADFVGHMNFLENWKLTSAGIFHSKDEVITSTLAFRPEAAEVIFEDEDKADAITGEVEYMEFRGSFYRTQVKIFNSSLDHTVELDFQPKYVRKSGIEAGKVFDFRIPTKKVHVFNENGTAIADEN